MEKEFEDILIQLAKRNDSKYDHAWYGEFWNSLFEPVKYEEQAYYTCFICQEKIIYCPIAFSKSIIVEQAIKAHGMIHLKKSGLLTFL